MTTELIWTENLLSQFEKSGATEITLTLRKQHFIEILKHHLYQLKELEKALNV